MTVYILGGGPAGLAVAHGLTEETDSDFVLLERGGSLGGLAQTLSWGEIGDHDLGPHKIFTLDERLRQRVEALLPPEDWLTRDKLSSIFMNGHFLDYPPSPFSLSKAFGLATFLGMTAGYGVARLRGLTGNRVPSTFAEDLEDRVGGPLYRVLFEPIARKLWGDPCNLDVKLSRGRVQTPSLTEILGRLLKLRKESDFEALTFRYPRGGLQRLWSAIHERTADRGRYALGHSVKGLSVANGRITGIECEPARINGDADPEPVRFAVGPDDFVVSSLPLGLTSNVLSGVLSPEVREDARRVVKLNDLLLVFLHVDKASLLSDSWVFVPDPKIAFHRVSEQESFDPGMTPNGSIVCCEIMSNDTRDMSGRSDTELVEAAKQGLSDMGFGDFAVQDERVIRLPSSYPVFLPGFETALARLLGELDGIENFRTIGRQGAFNYIGTLDAMDIGYGFARWYADSAETTWTAERERTNHYPVLD